MPVRARILFLGLIAGVFFAAGCGQREGAPLAAEAEEPLYIQGKQRVYKQGRPTEALVDFLKVIEKRGEQSAPESHLEAGLIYLLHTKDYVEAIHHFQKHLELRPKAQGVHELVNTAKREYWRSLTGQDLQDFSARPAASAEVEQLRRENAELRAEIATLRGGGATPVARSSRSAGVLVPEQMRPVPMNSASSAAPLLPLPAPRSGVPVEQSPMISVAPPTDAGRRPPAAPTAQASVGRKYVIRKGDGLYRIAQQFTPPGASVGAKMQEIQAANRIQDINKLPPVGTELTIP